MFFKSLLANSNKFENCLSDDEINEFIYVYTNWYVFLVL